MKKITLILVAFICTANITNAGVFRAGEITYSWISGLTYEFTLVTYTDSLSPSYPEAIIECGDGSSDTLSLTSVISLPNGVKRNAYIGVHTYADSGVYIISFENPNRIEGIMNIPNSVNVPFFVDTKLVINPFLGVNNSTVLYNPPIYPAFIEQLFIHNPSAYDTDGDSLVYILDICKGENGMYIQGYIIPQGITLDINTGDFVWDSPQLPGDYNFAIRIEEYRNGILIGYVIRDMQVIVAPGNGINDDEYLTDKILFFPNPSDGIYTLQFTGNGNGIAEFTVFNILGEDVHSEKLKTTAGTNHANIDLSGLSDGIYFLRAKIDENLYSVKIIKQ